MNLQEFLKLAGQQGKVVIIGDDGNLKGVFLPADEYQRLIGEQTAQPAPSESVAEKINRQIVQAQLEEVISSDDGGSAASVSEIESTEIISPAERIDSVLSKRAQELFRSIPSYNSAPPDISTDDEVIKPNFDDI